MALLYLVRHGETDWNREKRWQGHHDRPLSELGRSQASAAARRLAGEQLTRVYSSDLKRAWETAQMIAEVCGLDARADPALREVDVGNWAGLTRAEAKERFPKAYARRRAGGTGWEGGETYEQMGGRVSAYVTRLLDGTGSSERLALVCHSGVIRVLVAHALGIRHGRPEPDRRPRAWRAQRAARAQGQVVASHLQRCLPPARRPRCVGHE